MNKSLARHVVALIEGGHVSHFQGEWDCCLGGITLGAEGYTITCDTADNILIHDAHGDFVGSDVVNVGSDLLDLSYDTAYSVFMEMEEAVALGWFKELIEKAV